MEKNAKEMFQAGLPEMNEKECCAPVECDANSMEKSGKAKDVSSFSAFAESYKVALIEKIRDFENRETLRMFHEIRKNAISNGLFDKSDYSKIKEYTKNFTARFVLPKDNADENAKVIESGTIGTTIYKIVKTEKAAAKDIITSVNNLVRAGIIRFGERKELSEDDKIKVNTLIDTLKLVPETSWDRICEICKYSARVKNAAYMILKAQ